MKLSYRKFNKRGMLMWDALLTLFIVSLMMHSMLVAVQSYQRVYEYERNDYTVDFEQLLALLEAELSQYEIVEVLPNKIRMKDKNDVFEVILQNQKIVKTPGHHPYVYHIKEWSLQYNPPYIELTIVYDNQQVFYGVIIHEK